MPPMTLDKAMQIAIGYHLAGRWADAERLYRQILAEFPDHAEALYALGVLNGQAGRVDMTIELIGRAIALNPTAAEYHSNLGEAYRRLGRLDAAIASASRRRFDAGNGKAHSNLGRRAGPGPAGRGDRRLRAGRRLSPAPEAHQPRGRLFETGRARRGITALAGGLALGARSDRPTIIWAAYWPARGGWRRRSPRFAGRSSSSLTLPWAYNNLGVTLYKTGRGRSQGRLSPGDRCRPIMPRPTTTWAQGPPECQGRLEEAPALDRRAIELGPDFADAYNNLGNVPGIKAASMRRARLLPPCLGGQARQLPDGGEQPPLHLALSSRPRCPGDPGRASPLGRQFAEPLAARDPPPRERPRTPIGG